MSGRIKLWSVVALITALSLVGARAVVAGAAVGTGPDNAMKPAAGPVQLASGAQHWYAFNSSQAPSGAGDAQIMVRLAPQPEGSADFSVWTKDRLQAMFAGDTSAVPVGKGTVNISTDSNGNKYARFNGDQVWISSSRAAEKYYVVVQSHATQPISYTLSIAGNYVSFPTMAVPGQAVAATGAPASATARPAAATARPSLLPPPTPLPPAPPGVKPAAPPAPPTPLPPVVKPAAGPTGQAATSASNGPSNPYAIDGAARRLVAGQEQWYTFQSPGKNAAGNQVITSLELSAVPAGSASFSVWSQDGLKLRAAGNANAIPLAKGSLHPYTRGGVTSDRFGGNLQWSGALPNAGTYYVQVQGTGPAASTYTLQMTQK